MAKTPSIVALIPARSGSVRIKDKNIRPLAGKPLISYTIAAARQSGVFAQVVVSTDSEEYAAIARRYGAEVPFLRPLEYATSISPDIDWVRFTLAQREFRQYDCFAILRPTSPFRQPETIQRAWQEFCSDEPAESLRAVQVVSEHPGKMWEIRRLWSKTEDDVPARMGPYLSEQTERGVPWHSSQSASLPRIYVQNASLEIVRTWLALDRGQITGREMRPFLTEGYEGYDLNTPDDWDYAEWLVQTGRARLPEVE